MYTAQPTIFALTLASAICLSAGPRQADRQLAPRPGRTMGTHLKVKGIPNFGQVAPNLYRGAQPSGEGIAALKQMGVDVVVDLRGERSAKEESAVTKMRMQYVSIPAHCPFPRDEPFARFLKVIEENPGKKIFVHCRLGDDRTGMAVAAYRMADEGWSADEAMKEMKAFGFSSVHHAMCPGLKEYEEKFPERLKKSPAFRELVVQPATGTSK
jgi:tyrosine-protein phosphatase SIW14